MIKSDTENADRSVDKQDEKGADLSSVTWFGKTVPCVPVVGLDKK